MFKLVNKLVGFKTKNLYLAELGVYKKRYVGGKGLYETFEVKCYSFNQPKYIVCRKKKYETHERYKDVFTGSKYRKYNNRYYEYGDVLVKKLEPIVSNKGRIKYKDAEKILEEKNTLYIKR